MRRLEVAAWVIGIVLVGLFVAIRIDAARSRRTLVSRFEAERKAPPVPAAEPALAEPAAPALIEPATLPGLDRFAAPDKALWSSERIQGFQASLSHDFKTMAVLRVPKLNLEVPVLEGTDDLVLNRGVGHIAGTPKPGERGNVGIAGHRDGFFRGLKDISAGDVIELDTRTDTRRYTISSVTIVRPENVEVLAPTDEAVLTLVTCYPFYWIGSAPQRYIVRATLDGSFSEQAVERRAHAP